MLKHHKSEPRKREEVYQLLMDTKSTVQQIGYNVCGYLNEVYEDAVELDSSNSAFLLGEEFRESTFFYEKWNLFSRMTYRRDWADPMLNPKTQIVYDSDTGWGCTIRSSQMLLANLRLVDVKNFLDRESSNFSIHRFVHSGGKFVGDWLGPTSGALALAALIRRHIPNKLGVLASLDGRIYVPSLQYESVTRGEQEGSSNEWSGRSPSWELCGEVADISERAEIQIDETEYEGPRRLSEMSISSENDSPGKSRPVLILCPIRLSADEEIPSACVPALLAYMRLPFFAGLIGGPDKRCMYIPGCLGTTLLCIDPHIVQDAAVVRTDSEFRNSANPTRLDPFKLGSSLCISFFLENLDFEEFQNQINYIQQNVDNSFIEIRTDNFPETKNREFNPSLVENDDIVLL